MAGDLTRRRVLRGAGLLAAATAAPALGQTPPSSPARTPGLPPPGPDHPVSDVTARLSTYMSQARERALPDKALEQAKWHILDTIAAMVSGSELPPGRAATGFARAYGGVKIATVVADTIVCGPLEAALANGVLA